MTFCWKRKKDENTQKKILYQVVINFLQEWKNVVAGVDSFITGTVNGSIDKVSVFRRCKSGGEEGKYVINGGIIMAENAVVQCTSLR